MGDSLHMLPGTTPLERILDLVHLPMRLAILTGTCLTYGSAAAAYLPLVVEGPSSADGDLVATDLDYLAGCVNGYLHQPGVSPLGEWIGWRGSLQVGPYTIELV